MNNTLFDEVSAEAGEDDDQAAYRIYQYLLSKHRAPRASMQIAMAVLGLGSRRDGDRNSISSSEPRV